jgi:RimJ/RimL family protein N-acetyltransferase
MTEVVLDNIDAVEALTPPGEKYLRPLIAADGMTVYKLANFDTSHFSDINETAPLDCATPEKAAAWITGKRPYELLYSHTKFGIMAGGELVGCVGFMVYQAGVADLWYWVGKQHSRNGYATFATQAIIQYLFGLGYARAEARVLEKNSASRRTLIKAGLAEVGVSGKHLLYAADNPTAQHRTNRRNFWQAVINAAS